MVTVTDKAIEYMKTMIDFHSPGAYVTLAVKGGGCAGFQYVWGLTSDENLSHVKWSEPIEDVLVLDPLAEMYVIGSSVDYITEMGGSFLTLKNPQSTSMCGCGESFGI
jgi:iron-sulfur cluster insertion protein|tara:strand:- start:31 stop:354 length:324 start_codon:yes stop_codon:yes gene_type:complete